MPEATAAQTSEPTTSPDADGVATVDDRASPPTAGSVGVAPTTTPGVTPTGTPTGPSELIIRICWVMKDGQKLCIEFEIGGRGQAAATGAVVTSESGPPTRIEMDQGRGPAGFATVLRVRETEGSDPILETQGTIAPNGSADLRFIGDGVDFRIEYDEASGEVAIASGGQRVTGTFNPTTGLLENLTGEIPVIPFATAVMDRAGALESSLDTIVVASEAGHRMQVPEDDFCLPGPFRNARQTSSIGGGIAAVMGAGCCFADTANCAPCQTAASALASAFSNGG